MARINNLTNFLNDVAAAIKEKLGDNTNIPAEQFDTKIREIETGGDYQSKTINISANGSQTITPDSEYDALSSVVINVQVPVKQLQSKSYEFTDNTHIVLSPESGYDGFSSIDLTIAVPSSGGNLQTKNVTYDRNGEYTLTPDNGYDGISRANVTVQTPYNAKIFETVQQMNADTDAKLNDMAMIYGLQANPVSPNVNVDKWYLPKTITLPREVTEDISFEFGYGSGAGNPTLSSTGFMLYGEMGMDMFDCEYESEDGIHYTRTMVNIESMGGSDHSILWDSELNILYNVSTYNEHFWYSISNAQQAEDWLDVFKTIFREPQYVFNSLYRYMGTTNTSLITAAKNVVIHTNGSEDISDWTLSADYLYDEKTYQEFLNVVNAVKSTVSSSISYVILEYLPNNNYRVYVGKYIYTSSGSTNYTSPTLLSKLKLDNTDYNTYITFSYNSSYYSNCELLVYNVDMTDSSNPAVTNVTSQYTINTYNVGTSYVLYTLPVSQNNYITSRGTYQNQDMKMNFVIPTSSSISGYDGLMLNLKVGMDLSYLPAETQFTLDNDNQLLPGYIALGIDGEHVGDGSIYQNLDINQIVQTTLNRPLVHTGDYITAANEQAVKYFEYDTTGTDVSMETNAIEFYENINNSGYTPFMANYYGFQYLSLDKTKYFYVNTDKNLVKVDLTTNTSTVINLCTLADTSNTSVSLLIPKELLLYVKTDGHVYIYDVATDTEHDTTITINTSAYKGFSGKYVDDDYIFLAPSTTYAVMDKTIYAISVSTFLPTVTKTGMGDASYIWKSLMSNNYYFSIYTKSGSTYANQLWKFDGSAFTRLRSGGYTMGSQAGRVVLEDNTYIYAPYRQQQNFLKWSKTGSDAATSINVANNTSVTLQFDTMFPDGDYIWTLGHVNSYDYYWVKCTCSLVSQVPTFTEVEKVKIPYKVYLYDDNTLKISQSITGASHTTKTADGFQYLEARYSTYNNDSNRVVGNCLLKRVTESTYSNADIDGVCEHAMQNSVLYPVYHLM